ncbi:MAG TPA: hypothetical protein VFA59_04380 [Vicinamibacterales bacterium]|nr:hypothetical protein [Vicinamibacterales bacterium]
MTELSWPWIVLMLVAPLPIGTLVAAPVWRRKEMILGNVAGTVVIFGTAFALIFREAAMLDAARQACFDAGGIICMPTPTAFARYAIYASIGLAEVLILFIASLSVERRIRERDYAPEWRR